MQCIMGQSRQQCHWLTLSDALMTTHTHFCSNAAFRSTSTSATQSHKRTELYIQRDERHVIMLITLEEDTESVHSEASAFTSEHVIQIFRPKFRIHVCELHIKCPSIWITQFKQTKKLNEMYICQLCINKTREKTHFGNSTNTLNVF